MKKQQQYKCITCNHNDAHWRGGKCEVCIRAHLRESGKAECAMIDARYEDAMSQMKQRGGITPEYNGDDYIKTANGCSACGIDKHLRIPPDYKTRAEYSDCDKLWWERGWVNWHEQRSMVCPRCVKRGWPQDSFLR